MVTNENAVHRAAKDVGTSTVEAIKNKIVRANYDGTLQLSEGDLNTLLGLVDAQGKAAVEGSLGSYLRTFEKFKQDLGHG